MKPTGKFKLKPRESVLISVVALASMLAFERFWQRPNSRELKEIQTKVLEARKKIEDTTKILEGLKARQPASPDQGATQSLFDRYLSSNERFSDVITGILSGSKESGFSVQKITALHSNRFEGYTQTLYALEAESDFISIGKFLESIEDSPLLTEIESIDIARIDNELKQCRASIRLFGYVGGGAR